MRENI